jgi:hypothetical protein
MCPVFPTNVVYNWGDRLNGFGRMIQLTIRLRVGLNLCRCSEASLVDILPPQAHASKLIILYLHKVWICLGEPRHRH